MFRLVIGFIGGYVLGAKAGRERYDQIVKLAAQTKANPTIQAGAGFVAAKAMSLLPGKKHEPRRPDAAYLVDEQEPPTASGPMF